MAPRDRLQMRVPKRVWWVVLALGTASLIAILAAIWFLPPLLVDTDDLNAADTQLALNSARVPIGVATASVFAATSAAAGVIVSLRNVEVARIGLLEVHQRHELDTRLERERVNDDRFARYVEMLGGPSVSVRIGATRALVALAKGDERWKSTVVDLLCAYLRQPFAHPEGDWGATSHSRVTDGTRGASPEPPLDASAEVSAERQVRQTVLDSIIEMLPARREVEAGLAEAPQIRLEGATLDTLEAPSRALMLQAAGSHFHGDVNLSGTLLAEGSTFARTRFSGEVHLVSALFAGTANFEQAEFSARADFSRARVEHQARFDDARLHGDSHFGGAHFEGSAYFQRTDFAGDVIFSHATLESGGWFTSARFQKDLLAIHLHLGHDFVLAGAAFHFVDLGNSHFAQYVDLTGLNGGVGRHQLDGTTFDQPQKVLLPEHLTLRATEDGPFIATLALTEGDSG